MTAARRVRAAGTDPRSSQAVPFTLLRYWCINGPGPARVTGGVMKKLLVLGASVFLIAVLGLALFISTFSGNQQQFMFIAFFFMIVFSLSFNSQSRKNIFKNLVFTALITNILWL
jgi:hypothetical protein